VRDVANRNKASKDSASGALLGAKQTAGLTKSTKEALKNKAKESKAKASEPKA